MTEEWFENSMATRRKMAGDSQRPTFHFLPPRNWMNDPNGLFYWHGKYHLFYQFNPLGSLWGNIHWGHASSPDLVHWLDHPIALMPGEGCGDVQGCWSGCMVEDKGVPSAVYTGFVNPEKTPVLLARAQDPDLIQWKKSPHNPVIRHPPEFVTPTNFRDPYVWREDDCWKLVVGAGLKDGDSAVLLYDSQDLIFWDFNGVLFKAQIAESVFMWECPNFFSLGDRHVLLVSLFPDVQGVYYFTGVYDGQVFKPESEGYFETGSVLYAPQVQQFNDGRTILFAWLLEARTDAAVEAAGWAGVQAIPRELSLDLDGRLISQPIHEITCLRQQEHVFEYITLMAGEKLQIPVEGNRLEIEAVVEFGSGMMGFDFLASPDGEEVTRLRYHFEQFNAELDTTRSSLSKDTIAGKQNVILLDPDIAQVKIHVFIDGSVIEVWLNDSIAMTARAYPTRADAAGLILFSEEAEVRVRSLKIWEMEAIWPVAKKAAG